MQPTIMIVEDHAAVRRSIRAWLGALLPYCNFVEAQSGEEAVALILQQPPDLALIDIGLPGMNGIEATRRIKAIAPKTQLVVLSFHGEEAFLSDAAAAAAGASAFVCKQTINTELVSVIQGLLPCNPTDRQMAG